MKALFSPSLHFCAEALAVLCPIFQFSSSLLRCRIQKHVLNSNCMHEYGSLCTRLSNNQQVADYGFFPRYVRDVVDSGENIAGFPSILLSCSVGRFASLIYIYIGSIIMYCFACFPAKNSNSADDESIFKRSHTAFCQATYFWKFFFRFLPFVFLVS